MGLAASAAFNNAYNIVRFHASQSMATPEELAVLMMKKLNFTEVSTQLYWVDRDGNTELIDMREFAFTPPEPGDTQVFHVPLDLEPLSNEELMIIDAARTVLHMNKYHMVATVIHAIHHAIEFNGFFEAYTAPLN